MPLKFTRFSSCIIAMERSSLPVSEQMELPHTGIVSYLRETLLEKGYPDVLAGLPDDADERSIMARLVEIGPGMTDNADPIESKQPDMREFKAYVTAASALATPAYSEDLLGRVKMHAYDPQSPHRTEALQALSEIDPAAARILESERKRERDALAEQTRGAMQHTCCGGH
jgi:hypothetical protein